MRRILQIALLAYTTLFAIWSCKKNFKEDNLLNTACLKIDTINFSHSFKGWELYSWNENTKWKYSILVGTNAIKTLQQVKKNPISVIGEDSLKALLNRLPYGEEILWIGPQWLINNWYSAHDNISLPSRALQLDIKEFCDRKSLKLTIEE